LKLTKRFNERPQRLEVDIEGNITSYKWHFVKGMSLNDFLLFVEHENKKI